MTLKVSSWIITAFLVLLFIYAAASKLIDYDLFRFQIGRSPYLAGYATPVSIMIPLSEIIVVVMLITDKWRIAGHYGSFLLMLLFTGYVYIILHYADHIPCSCGGLISAMSWDQHFVFNIVVTILTMAAIILDITPEKERASISKKT